MMVCYKTNKGTLRFELLPNSSSIIGKNILGDSFGYSLNGLPYFIDAKEAEILIGLTSDITEEQAEMMVDELWNGYMNYKLKNKPVGNYNRYVKPTALDSFKAIMQHLQVGEGKWIVLFKPNE